MFLNNEVKQSQKVAEFQKKFEEKDEVVHRVQVERSEQMKYKRNFETVKRIDRRKNVERMGRKLEYQRTHLQQRIEEKMERASRIQGDLSTLLVQRQEARREIDKQKREIM